MDIETTKLELMQLLLKTQKESILSKIKNILKKKRMPFSLPVPPIYNKEQKHL